MHISHIAIKNFRVIADVDCELSPRINVIVGPNGVGKTTILQAARLAKALIAPRTQNEAQQVLISLGAASPHFPQRVFFRNLAGDESKPVEVRCTYVLNDVEIQTLRASTNEVVQSLVSARLGQNFANPTLLIQFLQSPQGKKALQDAQAVVTDAIAKIEHQCSAVVGFSMNAATGQVVPSDPLAGVMVSFLDQRLPPSQSLFSFFPADRALPMGEVHMQLGGPDAQQQLESHNSQPQLKYQRLKNLIINSLVLGAGEPTSIHDDFEKIFSGLLRERRIKAINLNELGLLSVMTEGVATGRLIELDSLSSGEKNVALTFLLVARSVAPAGIALFDEPELHLNPAVSRDLLPFVMEEYSKKRDIQFLMCTHSPEVLSGAFKDEECNLLHLKSERDITRVGKRAIEEYSDALQRLGTSVSETLFYDGTVFVEGESDVTILDIGFSDMFRSYHVKDRGGRKGVESAVSEIQSLEERGQKVSPIFLIFDMDEEPAGLENSKSVRVLQWPKYCIENYLIDIDVLSELMRDASITKSPLTSGGEVYTRLRNLAYSQLDKLAARSVYNSYNYRNASLMKNDLACGSLPEVAQALFARMYQARHSIPEVSQDDWVEKFLGKVEEEKRTLMLTWEARWLDLCDGKALLRDAHRSFDLRLSEAAFKERIIREMRDSQSSNWRIMKSLLEDLLMQDS